MSTQTLSPHGGMDSKGRGRKRIWKALAASVSIAGLVISYTLIRPETTVVEEESYDTTTASRGQLTDVTKLRIFFGHQSVGQNIIDAIPGIYSAAGVSGPTIVESSTPQTMSGGYIEHAHIGTNGDPLGKVAEFDRIMRSGIANEVEVAAMKLCYVDFNGSTDVQEVFDGYRDTLAGLERDYPNVTFMHLTVPLTAERDWVKRVKSRLGLSDYYSPYENVIREQFNAKIRAEYSDTGRLFDIAAAQSTVDGTRVLRSYGGANYYSMAEPLSSDLGHLNPEGAALVGSAFLASIAQAVPASAQ